MVVIREGGRRSGTFYHFVQFALRVKMYNIFGCRGLGKLSRAVYISTHTSGYQNLCVNYNQIKLGCFFVAQFRTLDCRGGE